MRDDLTSPAYAEAYRVCIYQGESELYAHQCGRALMGNDFNLPETMASAKEYEDAFNACSKRGRSMLYASLYADAMVFYERVDWAAAAYAWSYESQIQLGRSHREAFRCASIDEEYFDHHSTGDKMEEGSGYSEGTTVYAEAETRRAGSLLRRARTSTRL